MLKSQIYQGLSTQQMHISVDLNTFQDTVHYSGRFPHVPSQYIPSSTKIVFTLSALD